MPVQVFTDPERWPRKAQKAHKRSPGPGIHFLQEVAESREINAVRGLAGSILMCLVCLLWQIARTHFSCLHFRHVGSADKNVRITFDQSPVRAPGSFTHQAATANTPTTPARA